MDSKTISSMASPSLTPEVSSRAAKAALCIKFNAINAAAALAPAVFAAMLLNLTTLAAAAALATLLLVAISDNNTKNNL